MTRLRRSRFPIAVVVATVALAAGCGGGEPRLTVSAATSLKAALTDYSDGFDRADVRLSFAGSDLLAAQIRAGAQPNVFVSASTVLLRVLARDGLVERPVEFAYNRLVVAAARGGEVRRFEDLGRRGVTIAIGTPSVPVGSYARRALEEVPAGLRRRIEANLETEEPDAAAVIGRVRAGAVDAGFAYRTDLRAASELREIEVPARFRPAYAAAVVTGTDHREEARAFVAELRTQRARDLLRAAGFEVAAP
jgi:molybdate transport system substrate-binding protein